MSKQDREARRFASALVRLRGNSITVNSPIKVTDKPATEPAMPPTKRRASGPEA